MKINELFEDGKRKDLVGFTTEDPVQGDLVCKSLDLTSLKGAPEIISGHFYCAGNKLKSLEHGPRVVGFSYRCNNNKLTSLKGAPKTVFGAFWCHNNNLTTLDHVPSKINGDFWCDNNKLTTLKNIHKQINEIGGDCSFSNNSIKSHVLGLIKIKGLQEVELDNKEVEKIINKHLPNGDIVACQQDLIEAGFEEFAQL